MSKAPASGADGFIAARRRTILFLLIAIGLFLRLWQYAANISFRTDEAALIYNLLRRNGGQLLGALDHTQTAPPAFLTGAKLFGQLLGINEYSARLIPLAAGCLSVLLMARLANRLLPPIAATMATALVALSPSLIDYSTQFKQYSCDVLVALVFLAAATDRAPARSPLRRLALLCFLATGFLWLSEASVFVFAACSLVLAGQLDRRRPAHWLAYLALNLLPLTSFIALYFVSIRHQQYAGLYDYWNKQLLDPSR